MFVVSGLAFYELMFSTGAVFGHQMMVIHRIVKIVIAVSAAALVLAYLQEILHWMNRWSFEGLKASVHIFIPKVLRKVIISVCLLGMFAFTYLQMGFMVTKGCLLVDSKIHDESGYYVVVNGRRYSCNEEYFKGLQIGAGYDMTLIANAFIEDFCLSEEYYSRLKKLQRRRCSFSCIF